MVTAVCTGGDEPPANLGLAWLDRCGFTVAADGGLGWLSRWGRRADLWVGDGDSLSGGPSAWGEFWDEALPLDPEKDDSDTEAAVKAALVRGAREVWLLGGSGARMDHWWANMRLLAQEPRISRWLTAYEEAWNLGPGSSLELAPGTVSVFPLGPGPWKVQSTGLQWPLDSVNFSQWHSLSNRALAPGAQLTAVAGRFLVLKPFLPGGPS